MRARILILINRKGEVSRSEERSIGRPQTGLDLAVASFIVSYNINQIHVTQLITLLWKQWF